MAGFRNRSMIDQAAISPIKVTGCSIVVSSENSAISYPRIQVSSATNCNSLQKYGENTAIANSSAAVRVGLAA